MPNISSLLAASVQEFRAFKNSEGAAVFERAWLDRIEQRLTAATSISGEGAEREVRSIAHMLLDSGPAWSDAAPSFGAILDALQRRR